MTLVLISELALAVSLALPALGLLIALALVQADSPTLALVLASALLAILASALQMLDPILIPVLAL